MLRSISLKNQGSAGAEYTALRADVLTTEDARGREAFLVELELKDLNPKAIYTARDILLTPKSAERLAHWLMKAVVESNKRPKLSRKQS